MHHSQSSSSIVNDALSQMNTTGQTNRSILKPARLQDSEIYETIEQTEDQKEKKVEDFLESDEEDDDHVKNAEYEMVDKGIYTKPSEIEEASFWNKLFFDWTLQFTKRAKKEQLSIDDFGGLRKWDRT